VDDYNYFILQQPVQVPGLEVAGKATNDWLFSESIQNACSALLQCYHLHHYRLVCH
jgi:hypothetical protein